MKKIVATGLMPSLLTGCLGLLFCLSAQAQFERLDDSASPRTHVRSAASDMRVLQGSRVQMPLGRVEYRLNMAPHSGQRGRIYYRIPDEVTGLRSPAGLLVHWRGNGLFADGSARPGERVPVWAGTVAQPWLEETLDVTLEIDRRLLLPAGYSALQFESYFEIEILP